CSSDLRAASELAHGAGEDLAPPYVASHLPARHISLAIGLGAVGIELRLVRLRRSPRRKRRDDLWKAPLEVGPSAHAYILRLSRDLPSPNGSTLSTLLYPVRATFRL